MFVNQLSRTTDSKAVLEQLQNNEFVAEDTVSYCLQIVHKLLKPPERFSDVLVPPPPNEPKNTPKENSIGPVYTSAEYHRMLREKANEKRKN